jgi:phosphate uptake regulator
MTTRKIVQHGASSLTISLPHKWTKEHNLKKGDEINIETQGRNILIHLDKKRAILEKKLSYGKNVFLKRHLLQAYLQGYGKVILEFEKQIPLSKILVQLSELIGFEIVEQSEHHCVIINVASAMNDEFDSMLKRLFQLTLSFSSDTLQALENKNYDALINLLGIEKENNRLASFCQRTLNQKPLDSISETTELYSLIERIEVIADALRDLCKYVNKTKKIRKEDLDFFKEIHNYFQKIYINYYAKERNVKKLSELRLDITHRFDDLSTRVVVYLMQVMSELHHIEVSL